LGNWNVHDDRKSIFVLLVDYLYFLEASVIVNVLKVRSDLRCIDNLKLSNWLTLLSLFSTLRYR
jgi:hypothetical protein